MSCSQQEGCPTQPATGPQTRPGGSPRLPVDQQHHAESSFDPKELLDQAVDPAGLAAVERLLDLAVGAVDNRDRISRLSGRPVSCEHDRVAGNTSRRVRSRTRRPRSARRRTGPSLWSTEPSAAARREGARPAVAGIPASRTWPLVRSSDSCGRRSLFPPATGAGRYRRWRRRGTRGAVPAVIRPPEGPRQRRGPVAAASLLRDTRRAHGRVQAALGGGARRRSRRRRACRPPTAVRSRRPTAAAAPGAFRSAGSVAQVDPASTRPSAPATPSLARRSRDEHDSAISDGVSDDGDPGAGRSHHPRDRGNGPEGQEGQEAGGGVSGDSGTGSTGSAAARRH